MVYFDPIIHHSAGNDQFAFHAFLLASVLRVAGFGFFSLFYSNYNWAFCKQTEEITVSACIVCLCPTKRTLALNEFNSILLCSNPLSVKGKNLNTPYKIKDIS